MIASTYSQHLMHVCLELCFPVLPPQASDVELLCGILFLLEIGFELQFELSTDDTVVSAALLLDITFV